MFNEFKVLLTGLAHGVSNGCIAALFWTCVPLSLGVVSPHTAALTLLGTPWLGFQMAACSVWRSLHSAHTFLLSWRHRLRLSDHHFSASQYHIIFFGVLILLCLLFELLAWVSWKGKRKTSKSLNGVWLRISNSFLNNPKHTSVTLNNLFTPRDPLSIED